VALFDGGTRLGRTRLSLPRDETRTVRLPVSQEEGPVRVEIRGCGPLLAFALKL
jgi:hypothetical protein